MKKIKSIVFDLGGVLLNISYENTIHEFKKIGINNPSSLYNKKSQTKIFNLLETGEMPNATFILEIQKLCKASDQEIIQAWNSMILNLPRKRINLLKKLKKYYNLYLLSNTNSIHIENFKDKLGINKYLEFYNLFNKVYYSHKIGLRKPDLNIFQLILNENNLISEEVLFIDDSFQHIEKASELGINCYHLKDREDISTLLFLDIVQLKHH